MKISIYLAGKIKKKHEEPNEYYWSEEDIEKLQNSNLDIDILNPAKRSDDLSDQFSVFGRDMLQVFSSDIVLVDARDRRGLGVGAEMLWAKTNSIPVISLSPINSHYNKESTSLLDVEVKNWIHPFVESLSDVIVENLDEAVEWIEKIMKDKTIEIKGKDSIFDAMKYYKKTNLFKDLPMKELIDSNSSIKFRADNLLRKVSM